MSSVYLGLIIGLIILVKGADVMVDAASKIAHILNVPSYIVGLLIVSLGTSMPETAISIISGIEGRNLITLGNVVGANTLNIAIVLGLTALVFPLDVDSEVPKRQLSLYIIIELAVVMMLYTSNTFSRVEGAILTSGMVVFIFYILRKTKRLSEKEKPETKLEDEIFDYIEGHDILAESLADVPEHKTLTDRHDKGTSMSRQTVLFVIGLAALVIGANLALDNAVLIAQILGWSEALIGITVVSFGTCLPELVASMVAAFKKEEGLAVGNIVGSCIFNILFVLGISGAISPIQLASNDIFFDLSIMIGASVMLLIPTYFYGRISRLTGFLFILYYFIYLAIKLNH